MDEGRDAYGRRQLTERERAELLDLGRLGVWSTLTSRGRIHSVPVHYARAGSDILVLTETDSEKYRNAMRSGRATFCVEMTRDGSDRRFVMIEGRVVSRGAGADDIRLLGERYGDWDETVEDYVDSVILTLVPERLVAWSDAD